MTAVIRVHVVQLVEVFGAFPVDLFDTLHRRIEVDTLTHADALRAWLQRTDDPHAKAALRPQDQVRVDGYG